MDALAGDPRANAHYMELHKEEVPRREPLCAFPHDHSCSMYALIAF
jgi:hypothetical protein